MDAGAIALVISIFAACLLGFFLWVAEVRARWKIGAVLAFAAALALLAGGSPRAFAAGIGLQTLLAVSLGLYFKVEF